MKAITFYQNLKQMRHHYRDQRLGQQLMRTLGELDSIVANEIRGTIHDPYDATTWKDDKVVLFFSFMEEYYRDISYQTPGINYVRANLPTRSNIRGVKHPSQKAKKVRSS